MYKPLRLNHYGKQSKNCYVTAAGSCNILCHTNSINSQSHNAGRIVFIKKGITEFEKKDGTIIKAHGGEVLIFNNEQDIRYVTSRECEDFTIYFHNIENLMPESPLLTKNLIRITLPPVKQEKLLVHINNILNEFQFQEYGYEYALNVELMRILLLILRTHNDNNNLTKNINLSKIKPALFDMRNNCEKTMPLKYYADLCNMSLSTFQHSFTKLMNATPIQYINNLKLNNSILLLTESEFSILEISKSLGFSSVAYYSNLFKKHYGVSPDTYRKNHK